MLNWIYSGDGQLCVLNEMGPAEQAFKQSALRLSDRANNETRYKDGDFPNLSRDTSQTNTLPGAALKRQQMSFQKDIDLTANSCDGYRLCRVVWDKCLCESTTPRFRVVERECAVC